MPTPPTHLLGFRDGNSTPLIETQEDHPRDEDMEDHRRMPPDHPQEGEVAGEVAGEAAEGEEERSHCRDTRRLNPLKNS